MFRVGHGLIDCNSEVLGVYHLIVEIECIHKL